MPCIVALPDGTFMIVKRRSSRCRRIWPRKRPEPVGAAVRPFETCQLAYLDPRQYDHRTDVPLGGNTST
jgi:hypothetical protein